MSHRNRTMQRVMAPPTFYGMKGVRLAQQM
jgi:hypothetical protein